MMRMALEGPSGSGKTYSALLLAKGMVDNWQDIALADTENGSGDLYSQLGDYNIIGLNQPQSPERYIEAIDICEHQGIKVLILDSLSRGWEYLLDIHSNMVGNSFTNWGKITPRQNALIQRILSSSMHIIATMRTKQDYVINQKNGKAVPEKVGLKAIQRDGVDYEFTIVLDLDIKHQATASKDRTNLFMDQPAFTITEETGARVLAWCNEGTEAVIPVHTNLSVRINACMSLKELLLLYNTNPTIREEFASEFTERKRFLTSTKLVTTENSVRSANAATDISTNGKEEYHG